MARRSRVSREGFSLLELIIVLMVMISLLAIVWPNLQKPMRRNSLSEAAQTLCTAMDESRYQAITTGTPVFVHLRQGEGALRTGSFEDFDTAMQTWRLPASIVIADVRWTLDPPKEDGLGTSETGSEVAEGVLAEVQSDATFTDGFPPGLGQSHAEWWLPMIASGRGRDAAIVLRDTSINEKLTVTYASATGALEIVR